ncbi:hypothetical protein ACP70R_027032 [Stipagrostis hirtigluma subsp. patula]
MIAMDELMSCGAGVPGDGREVAGQLTASRLRTAVSMLGRRRAGHARFRRGPVVAQEPPGEQPAAGSAPAVALGPGDVVRGVQRVGVGQLVAPVDDADGRHRRRRRERVRRPRPAPAGERPRCRRQSAAAAAADAVCLRLLLSWPARREPVPRPRALRERRRRRQAARRPLPLLQETSRVKRIIRVPAISSRNADIPADDYSWRKYGQKPIKGSPYPRGTTSAATVRGCPARKHVERDPGEPAMLIVTYEGDHRHDADDDQGRRAAAVTAAAPEHMTI